MFLGAKAPLEIPRPVSKYVCMYVCKRVIHKSKKFEACKISISLNCTLSLLHIQFSFDFYILNILETSWLDTWHFLTWQLTLETDLTPDFNWLDTCIELTIALTHLTLLLNWLDSWLQLTWQLTWHDTCLTLDLTLKLALDMTLHLILNFTLHLTWNFA